MAKQGSNGDFTLDKALPSSIEAERLILGVVLLDNMAINQAVENLKPDDFFIGSNRRIYEKMIALYERGQAIDPLTLQEELRRAGELEQVGGPAYIAALFDGVPRFSNIENYVKIVKGKSTLRRLITAANQIMAIAFDDEEEPEVILDKAESLIFAIGEDRIKQGFVHVGDVATSQLTVIEETAGREQLITGLATGFADLDYMTSGLQRGDLIIIAARPSMGKCLAADSEIVLADGSVATIEEIYQRCEATLLTLGDDFKFRLARPSAFVDDGIKPVYRVTTRFGRYVDSTLSHPYLTIDGWRELAELKVGDRIAAPRRIGVFGSRRLRDDEIELLARASRDSLMPPEVFQLAKPHLARFLRALFNTVAQASPEQGRALKLVYSTTSERHARQLQHLLLRFGVIAKLGKSSSDNEPASRQSWRLEITDAHSLGRILSEIRVNPQPANAGDGIEPEVERSGTPGWKGDLFRQPANAGDGIEPEVERSGTPGWKGDLFRQPANAGDSLWRRSQMERPIMTDCRLLRRLGVASPAPFLGFRALRSTPGFILSPAFAGWEPASQYAGSESATRDVYWDEIVSIKYLGDKQVYDLTIPETHNFVANDICVHNTAFSLNIAQNAAMRPQHNGEKAVIGVFSLEMSNEQLVNRLLCSQARVDAHRLRSGFLGKDEWRRLAVAVGELAETKIYLDDTPGISVLEMRAKARRLKNEQKALDLLIVDYLQLMSGRGRQESRQQEVSQISRELKMLAKELNVPLVALSQLSRAPETRTGSHKPQLSDLRESGCLAGESLVTMADNGAQIPIRDLVGKSGFKVWALSEANFRLEPAVVSRAFATGVKPVFRLTTRLGRTIRATANHKFRAFAGWKRLDELSVGEHLALPRMIESPTRQSMSDDELALLGHLIGDGCTLPRHVTQYTTKEKDLAEMVAELALKVFGNEVRPRINQERNWYQVYLASTRRHTHNVHSAISEWLRELGIWGLRSYEKRIPEKVFEQPTAAIGVFLRHLWSTDGCIRMKPGFYAPAVYYASSSEELVCGVQSLLLRLGINAWLRRRSQNGKGRDQYHISLTGKPDLVRFAKQLGAIGSYKQQSLREVMEYLEGRQPNTNRDVIPNAVWRNVVVPAMQDAGLTTRQMMAGINVAYCGSALYKHNLSRERAARVAQIVGSNALSLLAQSDVYWDQIITIEPEGEADVYDLTVPGSHNFVAQNFVAHNSIEQDSDVVMFIYREEVYKPETEKQNIAEIIVGKQRNGPTGSVELIFLKQLTRFEDRYKEQA
jgi:replicative DNA helicase